MNPPIKLVLGSSFPGVKWPGVRLAVHFHLQSKWRILKLFISSPIRLHGVVLNCEDTIQFPPTYVEYNVMLLIRNVGFLLTISTGSSFSEIRVLLNSPSPQSSNVMNVIAMSDNYKELFFMLLLIRPLKFIDISS
jgi:hypothetical protein